VASNTWKRVNSDIETMCKVAEVLYSKLLSLQLSGGTGTDSSQDNWYTV
jgi:hypothetical protein